MSNESKYTRIQESKVATNIHKHSERYRYNRHIDMKNMTKLEQLQACKPTRWAVLCNRSDEIETGPNFVTSDFTGDLKSPRTVCIYM